MHRNVSVKTGSQKQQSGVLRMDDLKAQLAQLKKDLAEHRQLNETTLHGEDEVARSIEAEIERRIELIEQLLNNVERS